MAISADDLDRVLWHIGNTVNFNDLERRDWKSQTDAIKDVFVTARMMVDLGPRALFVDARIAIPVIERALLAAAKGKPLKGYINGRLHDAGLNQRRFVVLDTKTGNGMQLDRRGNSRARLHIHATFELPVGWTEANLRKALKRALGDAKSMGPKQIHIRPATVRQEDMHHHHSLNEVQANGAMGKVFYALSHVGSTYATLGLNEQGRRSRSTPRHSSLGKSAKRLAQELPSNFNRKVVLYDTNSGRLGREAFEAWVKREMAKRGKTQRSRKATPLRRRTGTEG